MGSGIVGDAGFFVPARMRRAGRSLPGGGNGGGNGDGIGNGNGNGEVPGEAPGFFAGALRRTSLRGGRAGSGGGETAGGGSRFEIVRNDLFRKSSFSSEKFPERIKTGSEYPPGGFPKAGFAKKNCTIVRISARSAKISRNEQSRFKRWFFPQGKSGLQLPVERFLSFFYNVVPQYIDFYFEG